MANLTLAQKLRTGHLRRWHMVRVLRDQTLAEHNALVQLIAIEVADQLISATRLPSAVATSFKLEIMQWALWHDMPEVITGDLSSPIKSMLKKSSSEPLLDQIENSIDDEYKQMSENSTPTVRAIVKFADLYEAINFLHIEGHGYRAQAIERELNDRMQEHIDSIDSWHPVLGHICKGMAGSIFYDSEQ